MIEPKTKTINGREVTVTQWGAMTGLRMGTRLIKLLGPSLAAAVSGGAIKDILDKDIDLGAALNSAIERLHEQDTPDMILAFFSQTHVDLQDMSNVQAFNSAFAGRYGDIFQILRFIVEVNYGDFSGALKAVTGFSTALGAAKSG